jgi:hypothetical protein
MSLGGYVEAVPSLPRRTLGHVSATDVLVQAESKSD